MCYYKCMSKNRSGFTLIELLVTMAIAAILITVALPNYLSARERARDAKLKASLENLKESLRLYYNDFQNFPLSAQGGTKIAGCGQTGTESCPKAGCSNEFSAGGATACGDSVYMRKIPTFPAINGGFFYTPSADKDSFRVCVGRLENASDPDAAASATRCGDGDPKKYCVCSVVPSLWFFDGGL
jgi:prepilin-type N-terminal cleavage/methylation domain-containing protein